MQKNQSDLSLIDSNSPPEALGQSEAFLDFQECISRAARVDRPVLLLGERGTGKELAARRLHFLSPRWREPLVTLNCAALAPGLIESELFGHEAGAFTGATTRRAGRFEMAHGGTLFLDEIGGIPLEVQEKILRAVEYGCLERVGASSSIQVDVRIVGATNADLADLARQGRFKQDLLDRLSFEVLYLPPLRERTEDLMLLARHFAAHMARELGWTETPEFSAKAVSAIEQYAWPGNVRELKNVIERAVYRAEGKVVRDIVVDPFRKSQAADERAPEAVERIAPKIHPEEARPSVLDLSACPRFEDAKRDMVVRLFREALRRTELNQRAAAKLLGLSYDQFRGYYRKYRGHIQPVAQ